MMAALSALRVVGKVADADFVAMDILPILWSMSLGPLLDLKQFQAFMELIKSLSSRVEEEQTRKLQELSGSNAGSSAVKDDFMSLGPIAGSSVDANGTTETDFELLVKGGPGGESANPLDSGWDTMATTATVNASATSTRKSTPTATFSWSSPPAATPANQFGAVKAQQPGFRTVTPDLASFQPITPTATQFSQPMQPTAKPSNLSSAPLAPQMTSINWGAASAAAPTNNTSSMMQSNPWVSPPAAQQQQQPPTSSFGSLSLNRPQQQQNRTSSFSLPPPSSTSRPGISSSLSSFSLAPPPGASQPQTQPQIQHQQRPSIGTTTSTPAFAGLGNPMSNNMSSLNSLNSLASMGAAANNLGSNSGFGMSTGSGTSMNSLMGAGMGMGMGAMGGMGGQQQAQGQGQGQKTGLDKYASLL